MADTDEHGSQNSGTIDLNNIKDMLHSILTQVQTQKSEIQTLVENRISKLKTEIQTNSVSVATEVKKIKSSADGKAITFSSS